MPSIAKKHLSQDAVLLPVLENVKIQPLDLSEDVYFRLIRAIVGQQLSGRAADTIFGRFAQLFPEGYPHPDVLLSLGLPSLRGVGLSNQKAGYVQNVARYFLDEDLIRQDWTSLSDEDILQRLVRIKGVGEWTVQMILIFALGRKDILPTADLAIRQSMQKLYNIDAKGKQLEREMLRIAEKWRPYRSIASRYLWRWRDDW